MAEPAATNEEVEEGAEAAAKKGGKGPDHRHRGLLLVLGGGGFAAFKLLGGKADAEEEGSREAASSCRRATSTLDPPFVVNFEAESTVRFLQVTIGVMTRDVAGRNAHQGKRSARPQRPADDPRQPDLRDGLHARGQGRAAQALPRSRARHRQGHRAARPTKVEALYFTSFVMQ